MTQRFEVTPQDFAHAAGDVGQIAERMRTALAGLTRDVQHGHPWGGDETGAIFGQAYTLVTEHALGCLTSHVEQMTYAAESLATHGREHTTTDQGAADTFTTLRPHT